MKERIGDVHRQVPGTGDGGHRGPLGVVSPLERGEFLPRLSSHFPCGRQWPHRSSSPSPGAPPFPAPALSPGVPPGGPAGAIEIVIAVVPAWPRCS